MISEHINLKLIHTIGEKEEKRTGQWNQFFNNKVSHQQALILEKPKTLVQTYRRAYGNEEVSTS